MTYALLAIISFGVGVFVAVVLMAGAEDMVNKKNKKVDKLI
jgi:hypothetical protein